MILTLFQSSMAIQYQLHKGIHQFTYISIHLRNYHNCGCLQMYVNLVYANYRCTMKNCDF